MSKRIYFGKCCKCFLEDTGKVTPYTLHANEKGPRKRAGVFLYNQKDDQLLVVRVCGKFIGLPKGGAELNETTKETALRELYEETGVRIPVEHLTKSVSIHGAVYFVVYVNESFPTKVLDFDGNDVNSVGWIHPGCLKDVHPSIGVVTSHLRRLLKSLLSI
jgi:8-oxo-dGTP pyrophosphatase MutT (NUDIX family)